MSTKTNKKIIITVNDGSIARNILYSFVLNKILERSNLSVGLIVPEDKGQWYQNEFSGPRVSIFSCPRRSLNIFRRALLYLARNGLYTKTILTDQNTQLLRDKNYISFLIKRLLSIILGKSQTFHLLIRTLAQLRRPSGPMRDIFRKESPDLLFATDVQSDFDLDAMEAARLNDVKFVGMVRSWDNLSSGGLVQIIPELLLVWNKFLYQIATSVQHIRPKFLKVVGVTQYDWYLKKEVLLSRQEFLQRFNIDAAKKVILFAGIGNFLAPHESEVAEIISEALTKNYIQKNVAVIFRPHPSFMTEREKTKKLKNILFDDSVAEYTNDKRSSFEMNQAKIAHLVNSLYHADLVITTASTITMDAVVFSKPVICIAFDGNSKEPYWNSVLRFYRDYTHYIAISKTNGFKIAYNQEDLIRYINEYLVNPGLDQEGRIKIREEFICKLDGHSAERIVDAVLHVI